MAHLVSYRDWLGMAGRPQVKSIAMADNTHDSASKWCYGPMANKTLDDISKLLIQLVVRICTYIFLQVTFMLA